MFKHVLAIDLQIFDTTLSYCQKTLLMVGSDLCPTLYYGTDKVKLHTDKGTPRPLGTRADLFVISPPSLSHHRLFIWVDPVQPHRGVWTVSTQESL